MPVVAASRCGLNVDDRPKADLESGFTDGRRNSNVIEHLAAAAAASSPMINSTVAARDPVLAVRPRGARLERRLTFAAITGEQLVDPLPRHTVGDGHLRNRAAFDNDSSDHQASFRPPASQARLCRLCLATYVACVMKQDTQGGSRAYP
jgi:hypothetical protein